MCQDCAFPISVKRICEAEDIFMSKVTTLLTAGAASLGRAVGGLLIAGREPGVRWSHTDLIAPIGCLHTGKRGVAPASPFFIPVACQRN